MARPRKVPSNLPKHIDYGKVPQGIYWDGTGRGRWYVRDQHPEGFGSKCKTVAGPAARLSDLHAIAEARAGEAQRGTVAYVIDQHAKSLAFSQLGATTQQHYRDYAKAIKVFPLKNGSKLGDAVVDRLSPGFIRRLIDIIAQGRPGTKPGDASVPGYPTKANHWLSYLRRVFGWAREHDHVATNPAAGIKKVKEKRDHRMPERDVFRRVQDYARRCSERGAREKGALPVYLWAAMELAYQARLRGIEVRTLTDHHVEGEVLQTNRRKGSRDNLVRKGEQTEVAIQVLQNRRAAIWAKRGITQFNAPLASKMRPLFVSEDGEMLTAHGWHTAWGRLMRNAVREKVIAADERFALHGLKHRGVTDTDGNKKEASGHKTDAMLHVYDHSLPVVEESSSGAAMEKLSTKPLRRPP
ncbi:TPA: tyrosine recombinase XerC [Stenotrophomonas maltophilia]|uniref:site-specific integrase n=1 Tax=Stenotrophomonas maltophilia TaxID=40324 RepID=UPI001F53CB5C|nr:integrase [Stenotrophomonas maltophilia]